MIEVDPYVDFLNRIKINCCRILIILGKMLYTLILHFYLVYFFRKIKYFPEQKEITNCKVYIVKEKNTNNKNKLNKLFWYN